VLYGCNGTHDLLHWHDDWAVVDYESLSALGRGAEAKRRVIKGIDFVPNEHAARYREAVRFIKGDPLSLGALVTTHKVNLLKASRDLFDELDPYAETLGEISSISKRRGRLRGHAKDRSRLAGRWRRLSMRDIGDAPAESF
jgi:shikimate 5-dehydrogenase